MEVVGNRHSFPLDLPRGWERPPPHFRRLASGHLARGSRNECLRTHPGSKSACIHTSAEAGNIARLLHASRQSVIDIADGLYIRKRQLKSPLLVNAVRTPHSLRTLKIVRLAGGPGEGERPIRRIKVGTWGALLASTKPGERVRKTDGFAPKTFADPRAEGV